MGNFLSVAIEAVLLVLIVTFVQWLIKKRPKVKGVVDSGNTYTVAKGDTLQKIAEETLGDSNRYEEIRKLNYLNSDMIFEGQVLKLPAK